MGPAHTYVGAALDAMADPRADAIAYLRRKLKDGHAGLDCYDDAILVVESSGFGAAEAERALDAVGMVVSSSPRGRGEGGLVRTCGIVEADVRQVLGLDEPGAPRIETPLASRSVESTRYPR